jgi:hypothetical protein
MRNLSTVRNLGKTARVAAPKVVQIKGKGFNAGGYDPRASNKVDPVSEPRVPGVSQKQASGQTSSYLPTQGLAKGGKVQAMKNGKGKVISCQNY